MESEFSRLMRYTEEPSGNPTYSYVQTDVTLQTVSSLKEEAVKSRDTDEAGDFRVTLLETMADAFQAGKRVRFVPVVLKEQGVMPLVVISIMPLRIGDKPEASLTVMDTEAINLLEVIFPTFNGQITESAAR
ncbi:MAG: hypothetical protein HYW63_05080 [Candidatus Levybacteria bacterium]|nr:hypothetical protein [Candidatus Levybacteria bacterium]